MTEAICMREAEDLMRRILSLTGEQQVVSPAEAQLVDLKARLSLQQELLEGVEASIQFDVLDDKTLTNDDRRKAAFKKALHANDAWLQSTAAVRETQRMIRLAETQQEASKRAGQTLAAMGKAADVATNLLHLYARKTELEAAQTRLKGLQAHAQR